MKIVAIYDSGVRSGVDRLTVITDDRDVLRGTVAYLGCDNNGGHSVSQWGELNERDISDYSALKDRLIFKQQTHLGHLVSFYSLPAEAQKHIAERVLL